VTKLSPPDINEVLRLKRIFGVDRQPLAIIPLLLRQKIPACKWKDAIENGPWSDDRLRELWTRMQDINPGVACGPLSGPQGLVVVDGDNAAALEWMNRHLPPTPMRTRTRSGEHWYYAHPRDQEAGNKADILGSKKKFEFDALAAGFDVLLSAKDSPEEQMAERGRALTARREAMAAGVAMGPVIDVRGRGGQVVLPGSLHHTGFRYQEIEPWHAGMVLPEFDVRLVEGLRWHRPETRRTGVDIDDLRASQHEHFVTEARARMTGDERGRRARAYLARIEGAVSGAGGHDKLFYAACQLVGGFEMDVDEAIAMLLSDYNSRCSPEWTYAEIAHKVHDAARIGSADSGHLLVDSPQWAAKKKMRVVTEFVPALAVDEAAAKAAVAPSTPAPASTPAPVPAPPAPVSPVPQSQAAVYADASDDERQFRELWEGKGVPYHLVRDLEWDRKKEIGGRVWQLPPTTNNLVTALRFSRLCPWHLAYNELKMAKEIDGAELRDEDELEIHGRLCFLWQQEVPLERVLNAITRVCTVNRHDPWQTFMSRLPDWDGQDHLGTFVEKVLGIDPLACPEAFSQAHCEWRHQLTGVVARGERPGAKMQTIMILVGGQGRMKSTLLRELFNGRSGDWDFFTDQKFRLDDKDGQMLISRFHACEWSEAEHAKNPKAIDTIKSFLAQNEDVFRPPYGRNLVRRPRRVVFFGTSNEAKGLLHDVTGNRRFYITHIGAHVIDLDTLSQIREQLWAQVSAFHAWYQAAAAVGDDEGQRQTRWWYDSGEESARQESLAPYVAESAAHEFVEQWLAGRSEPFTVREVFEKCLSTDVGRVNNAQKADMRATLLRLGATELNGGKPMRVRGDVGRYWSPPAYAPTSAGRDEDHGYLEPDTEF
jgi:hypothetical protein